MSRLIIYFIVQISENKGREELPRGRNSAKFSFPRRSPYVNSLEGSLFSTEIVVENI